MRVYVWILGMALLLVWVNVYVSSEPGSASCPLSVFKTRPFLFISIPEIHIHVGA